MSSVKTNPAPPSLSVRSLIFATAAFLAVATTVAMYSHRIRHTKATDEECVAVAAVCGTVAPENRAAFDPDALAAAITSKEYLEQLSLPGLPPATELSGHVRASVLPLSSDGQTTLTVACTQPTAERATAVANGLVRSYAEQAELAWRANAEKTYRMARGEVQARQQALLAAHQNLERLLQQPQAAQRTVARLIPPPSSTAESQQLSALPPVSPSSASQALQRRIDELLRRREELLRTVTEIHPAVLELNRQIDLARDNLAGMPRGLASPDPGPAELPIAEEPPAELPPEPAPVNAAQRPDVLQCKSRLQAAEESLAAAFQAERNAWRQLHDRPPIRLQLAEPLLQQPQTAPPLRVILMPIAAGLAAAILALYLTEAWLRVPRICTPRQLERASGAPVLGAVTLG